MTQYLDPQKKNIMPEKKWTQTKARPNHLAVGDRLAAVNGREEEDVGLLHLVDPLDPGGGLFRDATAGTIPSSHQALCCNT